MNELSGGPPSGAAPQRIEAGPGGYGQNEDGYGGGDRDLKPWQRVQLAQLHLGNAVEMIAVMSTVVMEALLHHGPLATVVVTITAAMDKAAMEPLQVVLLRGHDNKMLLHLHRAGKAMAMEDTLVAMVIRMVGTATWELHLALVAVPVVWALHQVLDQCMVGTGQMDLTVVPRLHRLGMLLHLR